MICQYCHATTRQIKSGKSKAGLQIYHCRHCGQLYAPERKRRAHPESVHQLAVMPTGSAEIPVARDWPGEISQRIYTTLRTATRRIASAAKTLPKAQRSPINNKEDIRLPTPSSVPTKVSIVEDSLPRTAQHRYTTLPTDARWVAENAWGWLPEIALLESLGLLIVAWAFVLARATTESAATLWWIGLAVMILPVALRLASTEASRRERIALVLLLGMSLYLAKVMHSPVAFTFPDELSHLRNVNEILESHRLFQENPVQPVTAYYPGLPTITSILSSLSGQSIFNTGILVIGAARLILFLALYLLFEQVSGSARVAGLATLIYMANPNFLYWTAEYAYEPLALPLLIFVLLMVVKKEMTRDRTRPGAWTAAALLGLVTVVITHHMSSYILTGLLGFITVLFMIHSRGKHWGPWRLALVALFVTAMWLIFVANLTINYLSPVLSGAIQSVLQMIAEEETGRELFKSTTATTESRAPLWEQLVAVGSVIVITLSLPLGAYEIWKRHRNKVFALLLGAIALAYLPVQMLRFTKAGWETANRSSEFLFIGIGFVLALGIVKFWLSHWPGSKSKLLLAGLCIGLFFGGLIAGWPPRARLARPYIADTGEHLVRPQIVTVAEWIFEYLGPDNRIAASKADAKVIGAYGQYPFTDKGPINNMFLSESFGDPERKTLLKRDIQYILSDRKVVSWDHMIGYYFYSRHSDRSSDLRLVDPSIFDKFESVEGISRLLDSGDIVLYDVERHIAVYEKSIESATVEAVTMSASIPPPGCIRYTVQPGNIRIDLPPLGSSTVAGVGQLQCLDWSAP